MTLQKTVFGRPKIKPNTFIGGVSATINTAALVASKLGISASRIKAFSVIGANIQFAVTGGSYGIPNSAFKNNTSITYFDDKEGLVQSIGYAAFGYNTNLEWVNLLEVVTITSLASGGSNGTFQNCVKLTELNFPKWQSDATNKDYMCFGCSELLTVNAPLYNGKIGANQFNLCPKLSTLNLTISGVIGSGGLQGTKIPMPNFSNVTEVQNGACSNCINFTGSLVLNNTLSIGDSAFIGTNISSVDSVTAYIGLAAFKATPITYINIPNCTTIKTNQSGNSTGTLQNCVLLTYVNAPLLETINGGYLLAGCSSLETVNMQSLITLGTSIADNNNFLSIKTGCTITVPTALATANSGAEEGDIAYARTSRSANIVYV